MYTYDSAIGQALALLRSGYSLPFSLRRELTEQGYDVQALQARYSNQPA